MLVGLASVPNVPFWVIPGLVGSAGVILLLKRILPATMVWIAVETLLTGALSIPLMNRLPQAGGNLHTMASASAVMALLWSSCGAIATWVRHRRSAPSDAGLPFIVVTHVVALLLGVAAAIIVAVLLTMRAIVVGMELLLRRPWDGLNPAPLGIEGIYVLGCLLLACLVALPFTRTGRIGTCAFWCAVMLSCWTCLQMPPLRTGASGGIQRSALPVFLSATLAMVVAAAVAFTRGRAKPRRDIPTGQAISPSVAKHLHPELSASITLVSIGLMLLTCFHLAIPIQLDDGGFRMPMLLVSASAILAGVAGVKYIRQTWNVGVADTATGLISLGLCGLATLVVPDGATDSSQRYPMIFNAMVVGFTAAAALSTLAALRGNPDSQRGSVDALLARLRPSLKRFAFLNGALGLVAGSLMAAWPRWPGISTTDDSLGRVLAGLGALLFHLLVLLWCSRKLKKLTLQILTVLSIIIAAAFLVVRIVPFSPGFG
jgi:hypothetical protein